MYRSFLRIVREADPYETPTPLATATNHASGLVKAFPEIGEGGPLREQWWMRLTHTARHKLSTSSPALAGTSPFSGKAWFERFLGLLGEVGLYRSFLRIVREADPYGVW